MNGIRAIIKKELRSYFYSPVAYAVMSIFLVLMGVFFTKFVGMYLYESLKQRFGGGGGITLDKLASAFYQNMAFLLCFVTPFLTMRLFAEERKQSTFELLFTAPITQLQLVLGKFLAAYLLVVFMVAVTFIYVFFIMLWGNLEFKLVLSTYLGLFLALSCYISFGALISALTNNQLIAGVLTILLLVLLVLMQVFGQGVTATLGPIEWGPLMVYLSPLGHFSNFAEGLIQVKDIVYFLSFTAVTLFLANRAVESNRWR